MHSNIYFNWNYTPEIRLILDCKQCPLLKLLKRSMSSELKHNNDICGNFYDVNRIYDILKERSSLYFCLNHRELIKQLYLKEQLSKMNFKNNDNNRKIFIKEFCKSNRLNYKETNKFLQNRIYEKKTLISKSRVTFSNDVQINKLCVYECAARIARKDKVYLIAARERMRLRLVDDEDDNEDCNMNFKMSKKKRRVLLKEKIRCANVELSKYVISEPEEESTDLEESYESEDESSDFEDENSSDDENEDHQASNFLRCISDSDESD